MRVIHPQSCEDQNTFRGDVRVSIVQPDLIPGYRLAVRSGSRVGPVWRSPNSTPNADGSRDLELIAIPDSSGGSPIPPTPGNYDVEIEVEFFPSNLVEETFNTEISRIVRVIIPEGDLIIAIRRPSLEEEYAARPPLGANQYPVQIEATITSQSSELARISYRLDSLEWIVREGINQSQVQIEQEAFLPPIWGGQHTITMKAVTINGDSATQTNDFFIPLDNSTTQLNDHRWDGGGDGINWHDPINWEEDRLPTLMDRAIVDLPGTEVVVVRSEALNSQQEQIFWTGAISIESNLIMQGNAVLRLAAPIDPSVRDPEVS
ncbi:MAG: hypothetical protein AAFV07_02460, partial [Bacteroidota bacterium]